MKRPIRDAARPAKKAIRTESVTGHEPALDPQRITHAEAAAVGIAAEALPNIALKNGKKLATRTLQVTRAWQQLIAARAALATFQGRQDVAQVTQAREQALEASLTDGGWWKLTRTQSLMLLVAIDAVIFLFDAAFFIGMYRDLGNVARSDWTSPAAVMATAGGLATPLLVFGSAYALGHLVATRRTWPEQKPNKVTRALTWCAGALTLALVVLFAWAAGFRFTGEASGPGSIQAPVALLAVIFGLLPAAAALFHTLATNPLLTEHRRLDAMYKSNETAEERLRKALEARYEGLESARTSLSDLVQRILTEADVQISRAHQLLLLERARSGRAGNYTPFATHRPAGLAEPTLLLDLPFPPRVTRLIEQAHETLSATNAADTVALDAAVAERLRVLGVDPDRIAGAASGSEPSDPAVATAISDISGEPSDRIAA
jgi:hypothetical protein